MRWRLPTMLLQQRIFERLAADLVGTAVEARVWDSPPDGTAFPLVLIGDMSASPNHAKQIPILDVTASIDVYSDQLGMEQVHSLASSVSQALTRLNVDLSAATSNCFDTILQSFQTTREFDGTRLIRHALMTFVFKVQDLAP